MMMKEVIEDRGVITLEEINQCIAILTQLNTDIDQIFEIPKEERIALIKAAGQFSRPDRDEFAKRKKDGKALAKRKQEKKDRTARKETGIRSAREASIFVAPKLLGQSDLASKEQLELETPRKCYVCKTEFTKMHHFYDS
ncbi:MAG TPA: oxidoreductase, partial [Flavobacterium sp.]|nr:oxidoreductase [Flavobacterium sp.]